MRGFGAAVAWWDCGKPNLQAIVWVVVNAVCGAGKCQRRCRYLTSQRICLDSVRRVVGMAEPNIKTMRLRTMDGIRGALIQPGIALAISLGLTY